MKLLRLRLKDYRGIEEREIEFPRTGVVILEGPNEIGKSSLAEALSLLLENKKDSRRDRAIRAVQPVGKDVAVEIEAEIECGDYLFRYFKRFLKSPATELTIRKPTAEALTGDEAHDHLQAILEKSLDLDLWNALCIRQAKGLDRPVLGDARSLATALDRASGEEAAGERESSLFERVEAEYLRSFTRTGQPGKDLKSAQSKESAAADDVAAKAKAFREVEEDVERCAALEKESAQLEQGVAETRRKAKEWRDKVEAMEKTAAEVERLKLEAEAAASVRDAARQRREARENLARDATQRADQARKLEEQEKEGAHPLDSAKLAARESKTRYESAKAEASQAQRSADLFAKDHEYRREMLGLEQLVERRDQVEEAKEQAAHAARTLETTRVDAACLGRIEQAQEALLKAEAQLEGGSPTLSIRALSAIDVEIDGEKTRLELGRVSSHPVKGRLVARLPQAEVTVEAGSSLDTLLRRRDESRDALSAELAQAGVETVTAAREALDRRKDAERVRKESEKAIQRALRDLTHEELLEKIRNLEAWRDRYPSERPAEPPLAPNLEDASRRKRESREERDRTAEALADAERRFQEADALLRKRSEGLRELEVRLRLAREEARDAEERLAAARTETADEVLGDALAAAEAGAKKRGEAHARKLAELQALNPESVRGRAENAERVAEDTRKERDEVRQELQRVATTLEVRGGEGLFEALEEARAAHARAAESARSLNRRAEAARLLYETMKEERARAQDAYRTPLREKIVSLGRLVFDDSFDVELDEGLAIASRTFHGTKIPFSELSVGTREQLDMAARLACALLVDSKDGVPLLLDDTLGHSDPTRLEGMGAMLRAAGEHCQVILLTCTPDRFRHVGGARRIRL